MTIDRGGRPRGRKNAKPSKEAVANYYRLLRESADRGDINAAGWLLSLSQPKANQEARVDG